MSFKKLLEAMGRLLMTYQTSQNRSRCQRHRSCAELLLIKHVKGPHDGTV
jgi:hypothetical protein